MTSGTRLIITGGTEEDPAAPTRLCLAVPRRQLTIVNESGTDSVFIGSAAVTTDAGLRLAPGGKMTFDYPSELFAVVAVGATVTVGVAQIAERI